MADIILTQAEADDLIFMEKVCIDDQEWEFPSLGGAVSIPLVSRDKRENFMLDVSRGRIDLAKIKYQNRARQVVILVRLELAGPTHRNPDGEEIGCPHIHIYREGFGDKWANVMSHLKCRLLHVGWASERSESAHRNDGLFGGQTSLAHPTNLIISSVTRH